MENIDNELQINECEDKIINLQSQLTELKEENKELRETNKHKDNEMYLIYKSRDKLNVEIKELRDREDVILAANGWRKPTDEEINQLTKSKEL